MSAQCGTCVAICTDIEGHKNAGRVLVDERIDFACNGQDTELPRTV